MNLQEIYKTKVVPALKEKFKLNSSALPKLDKVIINVGVGKYLSDSKLTDQVVNDLILIGGQKPEIRKAKKSIAGFKLREGMVVGYRITLRKKRMYDFLERLIIIALPRSRDFHGLDVKNIDQAGNLNIGIKEQIIFPEVASSKTIFSFQISVVAKAKSRAQSLELYKLLGFPLKLK